MPFIEIENASIVYKTADRTVVAVQDVDLKVGAGEFIAIVGPSGCGKSSLLLAVDGLIGLERGTVALGGEKIKGPGSDRAMVFQDASLMPWRTARENVAFGLEVKGMKKAQRLARADELLALTGLAGHEGSRPHQMSGGMRQRVGIARALAVDPQVLLMDEPFGALDAYTREIMTAELSKIWEANRKTVLFVTHSIDEAVILADRVVVMGGRPGQILEEIEINLPRPRDLDVREGSQFLDYRRRISRLIFGGTQVIGGTGADQMDGSSPGGAV
jgi:NitT/TauT family transport system ATP-binding protein